MSLSKFAQAVKNELALALAKHGSSLENFEESLKNLNTGEGVFKVAVDGNKILDDAISGGMTSARSIPEFAFKSSLAGGALAGLTLDEMDKSVDNLHKSLDREREKVMLVRRLTENLKREHGLI